MSNWTTKQIKRLRELKEMGYTNKEIAEDIGRKWDSVRWKSQQLGLKRKARWSEDEIHSLRNAVEWSRLKGRTIYAIVQKAKSLEFI